MQTRYGAPVPTLRCPQPSRLDLELTRRLERSGDLLGIRLLDHIVVGDSEYYSFSESGLIAPQEGTEFRDPPLQMAVPLPANALVPSTSLKTS